MLSGRLVWSGLGYRGIARQTYVCSSILFHAQHPDEQFSPFRVFPCTTLASDVFLSLGDVIDVQLVPGATADEKAVRRTTRLGASFFLSARGWTRSRSTTELQLAVLRFIPRAYVHVCTPC